MYQGEVVILILHQILGTNLQGNVLQLERILGVKGLIDSPHKNMSIIMVIPQKPSQVLYRSW